jgi:hypothetical protein
LEIAGVSSLDMADSLFYEQLDIIINRVVLIFVDFMDFMVHVKLENQDPTKYNFSRLLPLVLEHNGV